jgi:hypothetical protein
VSLYITIARFSILQLVHQDRQGAPRHLDAARRWPGALCDVTDLETAKFGASHGGGIQSHEQGAVIEVACRIDEPGHFLRAEHDGQPPGRFGKGNVLSENAGVEF